MKKETKTTIIQNIKNEGIVEKADNSGGLMEKNEYRKLQLLVKCTEDIEKSINNLSDIIRESTDSSNILSKRIWWLNFVLTVATVVIAVGGLITF